MAPRFLRAEAHRPVLQMAADHSQSDFGGTLREARERRGISLRQIANKTKISIVALEALERNDVSRLPGGIFSRAFVRSYATEVGLDPEHTIQEFIARFPHESVTAGHPQAAPVEDHQAVESDQRTASTFLWLVAVSVPIAGAVLYFTMRGTPPAPVAAAAPVAMAEPTQAAPPPEAIPEPGAPPAGAMAAAVDAADPLENPDVLSVGLMATRECWVSVTVDGAKVFERLMQAGERTSVNVRQDLLLTAGDAAAITLTLNGADARPLGADGQVVTARLNLGNFRDYLAGR